MTYHCGVGARFAAAMGCDPVDAHVVCDGCGKTRSGITKKGLLTQWMLKGTSPPGWTMMRRGEEQRRVDFCRQCYLAEKDLEVKP